MSLRVTAAEFLSGYRTYLVGVGFVVGALVKVADGDWSAGLENLGIGLGWIFLRSGVQKAVDAAAGRVR
ncbi:MAG: hypothetical protein AAB262_07695 [Elusimicrobiota bacterium]